MGSSTANNTSQQDRSLSTGLALIWLLALAKLLFHISLEEKYSIAVFGFGIVVGLLLTEQRRVFLNKWIWLGGLAAFLVFLPALERSLPLAFRRTDAQTSKPKAATWFCPPDNIFSSRRFWFFPSPRPSG
jgi:Dolichyl-phosphate-mannose-protein mannosyltransferase